MILRWCESAGNAARIAALSADQAPKPFVWKAESIRVHTTIERRKQALAVCGKTGKFELLPFRMELCAGGSVVWLGI
jgi:hypothetical protein